MNKTELRSLISKELKTLNYLLQNPQLSEQDYQVALEKLQILTTLLKEQV
jgi:hypothetical protein